ncbi:MAG: biotin carboxylase N-terminal domain-containing protein [Alphaproteobacteria bacterium]
MSITSLLIANRGEIACRIIRTAKACGIRTVAVYSDADANAQHVLLADQAVHIGGAAATDSYLKGDVILQAALDSGAQAIHPGYGFLSENADFAEAVQKAGLIFVGPDPDAIREMGEKDNAKALMEKAGVPVVPGYYGDNQDVEHLAAEAARVGYPVLIKAVAGGGGKGMRRVDDAADFADALGAAQREAKSAFGNDRVLIEKYVLNPRHIEVQVFGDRHGKAIHLYERDCSLQRRHQKVVEEAPAPGMSDDVRAAMTSAATNAVKAINYVGAGTIEFIADGSGPLRPDGFWFMEMNTRLQVEHPVTEQVTGLDLVGLQLDVAAGGQLPDTPPLQGHAIEVRLYAENPEKKFLPSTGSLHGLELAQGPGLRVDSGVIEGDAVTMFYDPMIAKLIGFGADRDAARQQLIAGLGRSFVAGPKANIPFLIAALSHDGFAAGAFDTGFIEDHQADLINGATADEVQQALLVAAATRLRAEDASNSADPWAASHGFRVSGLPGLRSFVFAFGKDDHTLDVSFDGAGVYRVGDTILRIVDGAIIVDGVKIVSSCRVAGDSYYVGLNGRTIELVAQHPFAADGFEEGGAATSAILAPMPGKVISLAVKAGDKVKAGQQLGVLEAMKMEHSLTAPTAVEVEAVPVAPGDQVDEGAVLIKFVDEESA